MTDGRCPGCGVERPLVDGATHPNVGASSACWAQMAWSQPCDAVEGWARSFA